MENFLATA